MDAQNFWFSSGSAGGGGGGDPGDPIGNSLRFRGTQRLTRTMGTNGGTTWTWSCWIKKTEEQTSGDSLIFGTASPLQFHFIRGNVMTITQSTVQDNDGIERRDPSAWYHRVDVSNGTTIRTFINGVETITWNQTSVGVNTNVEHFIGGDSARTSEFFEGYLADMYFIDGTALLPENNFGRFNDNDVWVPVDFDGDTDDYGDNGFHLDFSNPNDLGADSSGNGNDWTPNNAFNTDPVGMFSDFEAGSTSTYESDPDDRTQALSNPGSTFDGATAGGTQVNGGGGGYYYFTDTFTNITGYRLRWGSNDNANQMADLRLNGTTVDWTVDGVHTVIDTDDIPETITEMATRRDRDNTQVIQIEIQQNSSGVWVALIDNRGEDYDSMQDSPTQNYSTLNPLSTRSNVTLSDANMQAATTSYNAGRSTVAMPINSGLYYWEINYLLQNGNAIAGMATPSGRPDNNDPGDMVLWCPKLNAIETNGLGTLSTIVNTTATPITTANETVYKFAYNSNTQELWVGEGDIWYRRTGDTANGDPEAGTNPLISSDDDEWADDVAWSIATAGSSANTNTDSYSVNAGQQPFVYTPPDGFDQRAQTQNLPEPDILNGRDHFGILTYNGNGSGQTIGTDFVPGLIWFKTRTAGNDHLLIDRVRGGTRGLCSNDTSTETTNAQYISDFDDDGSIVTGNATQINDNNQQQVAWYWRADDTWASTDADVTAGTLASNGIRNSDAGFSIVTYTGNGTAGATVGHNLGAVPEFIIIKDRENLVNWIVYHHSIGTPQSNFLHLNTFDDATTYNDVFNQVAPTNTIFTLGDSTQSNGDGADTVAYCWNSIPGYSAFGSYQGNGFGSPNSPFIYLGFQPAFLMIKCSSQGTSEVTNWFINDTAREFTNPHNDPLAANTDLEEYGFSSALLDMNSNGFKLRGGPDQMNGNHTYVYAAWAENPFGGENTTPVPAR